MPKRKISQKSISGTKRRRKSASRKKTKLFKKLARPFLIISIWMVVLLIGAYIYYTHDLPPTDKLNTIGKSPNIKIYSSDGKLIADIGGNKGDYLKFDEIPPYLIQAVIATEDRRFFDHSGIDVVGIARAMFRNLTAGRLVQGGSTITQQLAKNVFLTPDRTIKRKIQELIMARWIEKNYSKEQIITLYLNLVYFGAGNYGIDAAARSYFGKSARYLTLEESALIAGLLKAPSRYSPFNNSELANLRANQVLANMVDAGYIKTYKKIDLRDNHNFIPPPEPEKEFTGSRYFVDWVVSQMPEYITITDYDIVIHTTLDTRIQKIAESKIKSAISQNSEEYNVTQGALLAMSPDGEVLAMVGGYDYKQSQFNRSTQALRQPGSAFKLFVYLAAFENGSDPEDEYVDQPIEIDGWSPQNYLKKYYGGMTLRDAFAYSVNTIAVQLQERIGRKKVKEMAQRLGITSHLEETPSLALGTSETSLFELTQSYAHMSSYGRKVRAYGIDRIEKADGEILYQKGNYKPPRIVNKKVTYKMNDLLIEVMKKGTGHKVSMDRPVAGKTGTTQNYRDAWFVGFSPQITAGIWLGNDDNSPMKKISGAGLPVVIWSEFMSEAHDGISVKEIRTEPGLFEIFDNDNVRKNEAEKESFWRKIIGN